MSEYVCGSCSETFNSADEFIEHARSAHGVKV